MSGIEDRLNNFKMKHCRSVEEIEGLPIEGGAIMPSGLDFQIMEIEYTDELINSRATITPIGANSGSYTDNEPWCPPFF